MDSLDALFGSTSRTRLLQFLLFRPRQVFSLDQLRADSGLSVSALRKELTWLSRLGLVTAESVVVRPAKVKGKRAKKAKAVVHYAIVDTHLLFPELRALFQKGKMLVQSSLQQTLEKLGGASLVLLTGAFIDRPDIRTDVLIVGEAELRRVRQVLQLYERQLGRELNYSLLTVDEFQYRVDIGDRFIRDILTHDPVVVVDRLTSL